MEAVASLLEEITHCLGSTCVPLSPLSSGCKAGVKCWDETWWPAKHLLPAVPNTNGAKAAISTQFPQALGKKQTMLLLKGISVPEGPTLCLNTGEPACHHRHQQPLWQPVTHSPSTQPGDTARCQKHPLLHPYRAKRQGQRRCRSSRHSKVGLSFNFGICVFPYGHIWELSGGKKER